jgi:hypothetical protein
MIDQDTKQRRHRALVPRAFNLNGRAVVKCWTSGFACVLLPYRHAGEGDQPYRVHRIVHEAAAEKLGALIGAAERLDAAINIAAKEGQL